MSFLVETCEVLDQRKLAILGVRESEPNPEAYDVGVGEVLRLLSGFDVDPREAWTISGQALALALKGAAQTGDLPSAFRSMWVDAFALGMLHERRCQEADRER